MVRILFNLPLILLLVLILVLSGIERTSTSASMSNERNLRTIKQITP